MRSWYDFGPSWEVVSRWPPSWDVSRPWPGYPAQALPRSSGGRSLGLSSPLTSPASALSWRILDANNVGACQQKCYQRCQGTKWPFRCLNIWINRTKECKAITKQKEDGIWILCSILRVGTGGGHVYWFQTDVYMWGEPTDGSGDPSPLTVGQFQNNYHSFIGGNKVWLFERKCLEPPRPWLHVFHNTITKLSTKAQSGASSKIIFYRNCLAGPLLDYQIDVPL